MADNSQRVGRVGRYKVWMLQKRLSELSAQVEVSVLEARQLIAWRQTYQPLAVADLTEEDRRMLDHNRRVRLTEVVQRHCTGALKSITQHKRVPAPLRADPTLKVKYVAFNGLRLVNAAQSEFGLKLGAVGLQTPQAATNGIPIAVTVEGAADSLCPPPGLAPVPGLCEVVVQGASPAGPAACCPATITVNSATDFEAPPDAFQCSAAPDSSPFALVFDGASAPQAVTDDHDEEGGAARNMTYSFRLAPTGGACVPDDGLADCCTAQLSYLDLRIVADLVVTSVHLAGTEVAFRTAPFNEPSLSATYRSLLVDHLNLVADDLGAAGLALTVTVRLPYSSAAAAVQAAGGEEVLPDLCDPAAASAGGGACAYYLHSEDGFCCPSGLALPPASPPPGPPGTCAPTQEVPASDTSMSLQYYERDAPAATTTFTFLLADHNPPGGGCTKRHCVDVCSWTLFLDPAAATRLALGHEDPVNNGRQLVLAPAGGAAAATLTFTYGTVGESTARFFLTLPTTGATLSDLCAPHALPGQGSKRCAAVLRSGTVFVTLFFDDSDLVITSPTPPSPPLGLCPAPRPLSESCLALPAARHNTLPASAIFDFALAPAPTGACAPPSPAGHAATVHLLLSAAAVDQLATRGAAAVRPTAGLTLDRSTGAKWSGDWWAADAPHALGFQLQGALGVADVCKQGLLPGQQPGSCVVQVIGEYGCFQGVVAPEADGRLVWVGEPAAGGGRGASLAGVVAPAVVLPVLALLAACVGLAAWRRRRRAQRYELQGSCSSDSGQLAQPLARGSAGSGHDEYSVQSASPSDVLIRVANSGGGAALPVSAHASRG
ncbi:hypothetical protein TSOC_005497, partial [Tetrabaena socialis]